MKQNCMNCGSVVEEGAKICPNCGRIIMQNKEKPKYNTFSNGPSRKKTRTVNFEEDTIYSSDLLRKKKPPKEQSSFSPEQRAALENTKYQRTNYSGRQNYGKIVPFVGKIIKIAIVLVLLYLLLCFVRVYSTKSANYKFDTKMDLPCDSYGEAFDAYFEDGSWHYRLTRNRVSYEGKLKGKTYKMTFKKENGQVVVDTLYIDSEEIEKDKIMDDYVLGMFMSEEGRSYEEKRKKQLDSVAGN